MDASGDTLARRLAVFHAGFLDRLPPDERRIVQEATDQAARHARQQPSVQVGEPAPDFTLPDQHDRPTRLREQLSYGPVILLFVRGSWCPFSALALRGYQDALADIHEAGASVLAITPEPINRSSGMAERDLLAFPTLSDVKSAVAQAYGITYDVPDSLQPLYTRWGQDLPRHNESGTWRLPLPATFVVGTDGRAVVANVPATIYERLEPSWITARLANLRVSA